MNVMVPLFAKSAATLMCLAADKVFMGEFGELGPIDIQIDDQVQHGGKNFSPLDEFKSIVFMREQAIEWMEYYAVVMNRRYGIGLKEALRDSIPLVSGLMRPMFEKLAPLEMGGHRRALAIGEEYARRMLALAKHQDPRPIVDQLVWEYPSHDFAIDRDEALALGLPIHKLSEAEDQSLTEANLGLGKDDSYHGFATKVPSRASRQMPAPAPGGSNGISRRSRNRRAERS